LSRDLDRSLDVSDRIAGRRPSGYRALVYQGTGHTVDLSLARGFAYESSMMADDAPNISRTGRGDLVEIPPHWGTDVWVATLDEIARHVLAERDRGAGIRVERFPCYTERQQ
jgi:hypothetical protein